MKKYKLAIVFGRFQPLHDEHCRLIAFAESVADKVLILIGSTNESRSAKNPFSFGERKAALSNWAITVSFGSNLYGLGIKDYLYDNDYWAEQVRATVKLFPLSAEMKDEDICIVGHHKDESSFYLNLFPEWELVEYKNSYNLSSTNIRDVLFGGKVNSFQRKEWNQVPSATKHLIYDSLNEEWFTQLRAEYQAGVDYRKSWEVAPFPPIFMAVDNLVLYKDELILIERKSEFGNGKLAMAGGYLDPHEFLIDGALRELKEETNIDSSFLRQDGPPVIFDNPNRSTRGRMLTQVYTWRIDGDIYDTDYKAGDDARRVVRLQIKHLETHRPYFFSDHFHIIFNILRKKELL